MYNRFSRKNNSFSFLMFIRDKTCVAFQELQTASKIPGGNSPKHFGAFCYCRVIVCNFCRQLAMRCMTSMSVKIEDDDLFKKR
jgi:hypothetical protein